jgi:hypothetical protein
MDLTPPGEETPKDYATRRIDLEQPESSSEGAAPEAEKKSRTRKTADRPAAIPAAATAVTVTVDDQPLPPPPSQASTPPLSDSTHKNERVWIAAIIGICIVALACICSCTIVG